MEYCWENASSDSEVYSELLILAGEILAEYFNTLDIAVTAFATPTV